VQRQKSGLWRQELILVFEPGQIGASQKASLKRQICEDRIGNQQYLFNIIKRKSQRLGSVRSIVYGFADLSVAHKSLLVSTRLDRLNLSNHSADLLEKMDQMKTWMLSPVTRYEVETAVKLAVQSH